MTPKNSLQTLDIQVPSMSAQIWTLHPISLRDFSGQAAPSVVTRFGKDDSSSRRHEKKMEERPMLQRPPTDADGVNDPAQSRQDAGVLSIDADLIGNGRHRAFPCMATPGRVASPSYRQSRRTNRSERRPGACSRNVSEGSSARRLQLPPGTRCQAQTN